MDVDKEKNIERYLYNISLLTQELSNGDLLAAFLVSVSINAGRVSQVAQKHLDDVRIALKLEPKEFNQVIILIKEIYLSEMLYRSKN